MNLFFAAFFLLIGFAYVIVLRKSVASALAHGERFPGFHWCATESWITIAVAGFFVLTAALSFGREPAKIDLRSLESSLALYGGIAVFLLGVLVSRNVPLWEAFGLKPASWGRLGWMTLFALGMMIPSVLAAQWAAYELLGPETSPQPIVEFLIENSGWRERLAVALIAVVAAPVTEELVFRGCLYGVARQRLGRLPSILGTSLVFALIHAHAATIPALFVLAIGLALLYEATGSLWAPILAHAAFNGLNVLGALYWPEMIQ